MPSHFALLGRDPTTEWRGGWVRPKPGVDRVRPAPTGKQTPSVQPTARTAVNELS